MIRRGQISWGATGAAGENRFVAVPIFAEYVSRATRLLKPTEAK